MPITTSDDMSHHEGRPAVLDPQLFRRVLGHFCSGIAIITARDGEMPIGFTCQSVFSLSVNPPLVAFSPSRTSSTYRQIREAGAFCINVLAEEQQELSARFACIADDRWSNVDWREGPLGSPMIANSLAWISCRLQAEHEAGDHYLVVGEVVDLAASDGNPLLYFKGSYKGLGSPSESAWRCDRSLRRQQGS
ncbi:flavin reductase family protein [Sphingosinicella terrae]|uniref:flavin reductase family protein n=1 Tax=Sphingosinicella terrae TaxID=2172047 RepID=UPI002548A729|nr:flavin reductase family protein [Sphingosinicella terrae]